MADHTVTVYLMVVADHWGVDWADSFSTAEARLAGCRQYKKEQLEDGRGSAIEDDADVDRLWDDEGYEDTTIDFYEIEVTIPCTENKEEVA